MASLTDLCERTVVTLFEVRQKTWREGPGSQPAHGVSDPVDIKDISDNLYASNDSASHRVSELQKQKVKERFSEPCGIGEQCQGDNYFRAYLTTLNVDKKDITINGKNILYQGRPVL